MRTLFHRWQARQADRARGEGGMTMLEVLVSMVLLGIVATVFATAMVSTTKAANKVVTLTDTADNVNTAFLSMDRTVRYASMLSTPGRSTTSNAWYVEARTTNTGAQQCTQWRVDVSSKQLQSRTWNVVNSAASGTTAWKPLANLISNGAAAVGSADQPFVVIGTTDAIDSQRLTVTLVASTPSTSASGSTSRTAMTIAAINSSSDNSDATAAAPCQELGRP